MKYFVSKQRVSVRDGFPIKNARRRLVGNIEAPSVKDAEELFSLFYADMNDDKHRFELTDGQWNHIAYIQQGELS